MRIKSSVLFGLIVVICAISGFSLLKRLTHEVDEWRPSDLYSSTNVSRRSTYSVVSSAPVSYSEALPTVSSGSGSMFRRRAVSSYAPASGLAGQSSMTGTASYSQSPIAYRSGIRFHRGTKPEHSTGCILVVADNPNRSRDIDSSGKLSKLSSKYIPVGCRSAADVEQSLTQLLLQTQESHEEIILEVIDFRPGTDYGYDTLCPPELQKP